MQNSSDFLGTIPVPQLFRQMSFPIMLGLLITGMYNVVDAIYVAQGLGAAPMAALGVSFPVQLVLLSVSSLVGIGSAATISRMLGEGDKTRAEQTITNGILVCIILGVVFFVLSWFLIEWILERVGATAEVFPHTIEYLLPLLMFSVLGFVMSLLADVLRSEGKSKYMTAVIATTAGLNILLDPIFIFWLDFGIQGAAIATLVSQLVAIALAISFFVRGKTYLRLNIRIRHIKPESMANIFKIGIPTMLSNIGVAILIAIANIAIANIDSPDVDNLLAGYGIVGRLMSFTILPMIGMMIGFQTICGFNFGARKYSRVREVIRVACRYMVVYAMGFAAIMLWAPQLLILPFTSEPMIVEYASHIFGFIGIAYSLIGLPFIGISMFQALGRARSALLLSVLRIYVLSIPLLFILPPLFGLNGVWISLMMSDFLSGLLAIFLVALCYRQIKRMEALVPA